MMMMMGVVVVGDLKVRRAFRCEGSVAVVVAEDVVVVVVVLAAASSVDLHLPLGPFLVVVVLEAVLGASSHQDLLLLPSVLVTARAALPWATFLASAAAAVVASSAAAGRAFPVVLVAAAAEEAFHRLPLRTCVRDSCVDSLRFPEEEEEEEEVCRISKFSENQNKSELLVSKSICTADGPARAALVSILTAAAA